MKKASAILCVCLLWPLFSWAEKTSSRWGEQATSSLDALKKANQYSFDTGGIGILIAYGSGNGVRPEKIGDAFAKEIKRRGMMSKYFFYNADWPGMTVEFHIGYSAMGPWDADTAALQVSKAVARAKAAQKVHGN